MLRNDSQTGSVPVKTVCTAENKRFVLLFIIPHQRVCKRVSIVVKRRVDRHSGSFVYHYDIFIFIDNIDRQIDSGIFGEEVSS